jgi:uncharacterized protein YqgC (DUF456 family)
MKNHLAAIAIAVVPFVRAILPVLPATSLVF